MSWGDAKQKNKIYNKDNNKDEDKKINDRVT